MIRTFGYARQLSTGAPAPLATVNVYQAGTLTPATIFADNLIPPTPLGNPFTADATGYFDFYAAGGHYDVRFSGTALITVPYTWGDVFLPDGLGLTCYNVKDYGALGNGIANDTTAIQNAIDAANTAGGGLVYFPPGTYHHTGLVAKDHVTMLGAGRNVSVLTFTPAVGDGLTGHPSYFRLQGLSLIAQATSGWAAYFTSFSSSVFEDFEVDATKGIFLGASINASLVRGGLSGPGGTPQPPVGSIGIQVGDYDLGYHATTTTLINMYVSGFETDVYNHGCSGLELVQLICEDALTALQSDTETAGSIYTEDIITFTWKNGAAAYVLGETVHGSVSGAKGDVGSYTSVFAATGRMTLNNLVGTWQIGENILKADNVTVIGLVDKLGYSINDTGSDPGGPWGSIITPLTRPDNLSHVNFGGIGVTTSIGLWRKFCATGRCTTNQVVPAGVETTIVFNKSAGSAMMTRDLATGKQTIQTEGWYHVAVNVTIDTAGDLNSVYTLKVYRNATLMGQTKRVNPVLNLTSFKLDYVGVITCNPGDVLSVTLTHNDTTGGQILKNNDDFVYPFTAFSTAGIL